MRNACELNINKINPIQTAKVSTIVNRKRRIHELCNIKNEALINNSCKELRLKRYRAPNPSGKGSLYFLKVKYQGFWNNLINWCSYVVLYSVFYSGLMHFNSFSTNLIFENQLNYCHETSSILLIVHYGTGWPIF